MYAAKHLSKFSTLSPLSHLKRDLKADDWKVNGVGRWYSHSFGYGIMDAGRMVELSKNWKNVKSQEEYSKIIIHRANKNAHLRTGLSL